MNTNTKNADRKSTNTRSAGTLSLASILEADVYPFSAEISLGGGQVLTIQYRPAPESAKDRVQAALAEGMESLGLDPAIALRGVKGRLPTPEEAARFQAQYEALGENAGEQVEAVIEEVGGLAISLLIGEWNLSDPITPANCAALPKLVKEAITRLAQSAELPVDKVNFSAG